MVAPPFTGHLHCVGPTSYLCNKPLPTQPAVHQKGQAAESVPTHPDSKEQTFNYCVVDPHITQSICSLPPCGQRCQPTLEPASRVETERPVFDVYQQRGMSAAPGHGQGVAEVRWTWRLCHRPLAQREAQSGRGGGRFKEEVRPAHLSPAPASQRGHPHHRASGDSGYRSG